MPVITFRVDDQTKKMMDQLREVNWSEVARKAIEQKIAEAELWRPVDTTLLKKASDDTDSLRRTIKGWESTTEIRKWRERDQKH
jgi:negative regulator of sigma E activity